MRSTAAVSTGASAMRRKSSAAASGCESKLPTETTRPSPGTTSGLPWCAFSSIASCCLDEPQRVARGAVQLRDAAERQRVLQVAGGLGLPERAPAKQRVHALDGLRDAGIRPRGGDLGVQRSRVRTEGLEVERRRDVDPIEERAGVGDRECGLAGRVRVAGEEPERLAGLELELAESAVGEIRVLREVGLADRPERVDVRTSSRG